MHPEKSWNLISNFSTAVIEADYGDRKSRKLNSGSQNNLSLTTIYFKNFSSFAHIMGCYNKDSITYPAVRVVNCLLLWISSITLVAKKVTKNGQKRLVCMALRAL